MRRWPGFTGSPVFAKITLFVVHCAPVQPAIPRQEPLATRAWRFGRALIVGSGATLTDFSVFTTCVRAIDLAPTTARLPALIAGACIQFLGNRSFTFRAQGGSLPRQVKLFLIAEAITLGLNWSVFRFLIARITALPPELVSFLGTFLVFISFAYPVRRLVVFRVQ